jgi:hypothetical protein
MAKVPRLSERTEVLLFFVFTSIFCNGYLLNAVSFPTTTLVCAGREKAVENRIITDIVSRIFIIFILGRFKMRLSQYYDAVSRNYPHLVKFYDLS